MSRVANIPIGIPTGVNVAVSGQDVTVKGKLGSLRHTVHASVNLDCDGSSLRISTKENTKSAVALAGTSRAILNNMVIGVSRGFEKRLVINGVGYRVQLEKGRVNLTLGYSHAITFSIPEGVSVETPSPTEIVVRGSDKQKVGQVAANIRAYRPPEPYKGKGVRYSGESIIRKEAKKA
jgi:large subunit ribosomal protein L6